MIASVLRVLVNVGVYGALLLVPAGTLRWQRAWVLLGLVAVGMLVTRAWVFGANPDLLHERRRAPFQPGQPDRDKRLVIAFVVVFPAFIAFIALDVWHLHLLPQPPAVISTAGLLCCGAGWLLISLAFRENAFALAIVRDQSDRGQVVVSSGVYGIVRHPLYAGVVLIVVGMALWLQSTAAALASVVPIALLVLRIGVEEDFLRSRLSGYDAYTNRVRQRLIPGIW